MKFITMKKGILVLLSVFLFAFSLNADNHNVKTIQAKYLTGKIKIDGVINEPAWRDAPVATNFVQFEPDNGGKASERTEVKVLYDNSGIYIGAVMYDNAPDSIRMDLSKRDEDAIADIFSVSIDPFNNGLYAFTFMVTAAGVQSDMKITIDDMDRNWDAVWDSEVSRFDKGWIAEIKIPYSALRFSTAKVQTWKINFYRIIARKMEIDSWQFVDKTKPGIVNQYGLLTGLKDIKPPLRLAFMPYISGYANNVNGKWAYLTHGGMDLKYGINESFTLDMMLIPDFGQVESDDKVLNLSPFETYYVEKRQFFTEGSELFNKADIFYSRRIGAQPLDYSKPYNELKPNEIVESNPSQTQILNATKITGRTNHGLGVGFLNAITAPSYALIKDTVSGDERKILTQGLSNYNVMVLDQSLPNNSYVSLINTDMYVAGGRLLANVSATEYQLRFAKGLITLKGKSALSQRYTIDGKPQIGYRTNIEIKKSKGNFQYGAETDIMNDKYDINDLGFLRRNNSIENNVFLKYNQVRPTKYFLNWSARLSYSYKTLYQQGRFESSSIHGNVFMQFKNLWHMYIFNYTELTDEHDWYEPRVWGRFYRNPRNTFFVIGLGSDPSKNISFNINANAFYANKDKHGYSMNSGLTLRLSNRFNVNYSFNFSKASRFGFVDYVNYDTIYFGLRNEQTLTNTINLQYNFTNKHSLNMRLRHYWSIADYNDQFYFLKPDGYLEPSDFKTNADINFNAFTIDLTYTWNFAPGSELTVMWKNQIYTTGQDIDYNFINNLTNTIKSPQSNSFSIKILYYLDWTYFNHNVKPKIAEAFSRSKKRLFS